MIHRYLTLDVTSDAYQQRIKARQGENKSRILIITLVNKNEPVKIPEGAEVTIIAKIPNGSEDITIFNHCEVSEDRITVAITSGMCAVLGSTPFELKVISQEATLYTSQFLIDVEANLDAEGAVQASSEFTELDSLIQRTEQILEKDVPMIHEGTGEPEIEAKTGDVYIDIVTGRLFMKSINDWKSLVDLTTLNGALGQYYDKTAVDALLALKQNILTDEDKREIFDSENYYDQDDIDDMLALKQDILTDDDKKAIFSGDNYYDKAAVDTALDNKQNILVERGTKNLWDEKELIVGQQIDGTTHQLKPGANFAVYYFDAKENTGYVIQKKVIDKIYIVPYFYGENDEFISKGLTLSTTTSNWAKFTTPAGTKKVGLSIRMKEGTAVYDYSDTMIAPGTTPREFQETNVVRSSALDIFDRTKNSFSAFKKFCVIGDSLSVGWNFDKDTGTRSDRNIPYSWGQALARFYGSECLNIGRSGADTTEWLDEFLDTLKAPGNKAQAYCIGLGVNDQIETGEPGSITIAQFKANYRTIIDNILQINTAAKIFCYSMIKSGNNKDLKNEAIKEVVELYPNAYFVDIAGEYIFAYNKDFINDYELENHFTAAGYVNLGMTNGMVMSDIMDKNAADFWNIFKIPYDPAPTPTGGSSGYAVQMVDALPEQGESGVIYNVSLNQGVVPAFAGLMVNDLTYATVFLYNSTYYLLLENAVARTTTGHILRTVGAFNKVYQWDGSRELDQFVWTEVESNMTVAAVNALIGSSRVENITIYSNFNIGYSDSAIYYNMTSNRFPSQSNTNDPTIPPSSRYMSYYWNGTEFVYLNISDYDAMINASRVDVRIQGASIVSGGVADIPMASAGVWNGTDMSLGLIRNRYNTLANNRKYQGLVVGDGGIVVSASTKDDITSREGVTSITPSNLNDALRYGLGDGKILTSNPMSADEQANAQKWLGIYPSEGVLFGE